MKLRSQLVLAFLLLAVVPLSGIVLYSYITSSQAVKQAARSEAKELAQEMEGHLDATRQVLWRRVSQLPLATLVTGDEQATRQLQSTLKQMLGDVAPVIDSLVFKPAPPSAPEPPSGASAPVVPGVDLNQELAPDFDVPPIAFFLEDDEIDDESLELLREAHEEDQEAHRERLEEHQEHLQDAEELRLENTEELLQTIGELGAAIVQTEVEAWIPPLGESGEEPSFAEILRWAGERRAEIQRIQANRQQPDAEQMAAKELETSRLLGEGSVEVRDQGRLLGMFRPHINPDALMTRIFEHTNRGKGELPFAIDTDGQLYTDCDFAELQQLESLDLDAASKSDDWWVDGRWVIATAQDEETGLRFGVARPFGDHLQQLQSTTARNFGYGLALIGLAVLGILPLSRRISGYLQLVTAGAAQVARGELDARVPVRGKNEISQLASTFNQMAEDLRDQRQQLVEQESQRRDEQLAQGLMHAEYQRKSQELEEARQFQLSLLPKQLPSSPRFELAVHMRTATEVGGDYYDFAWDAASPDGLLTMVLGDATGHGARAGTMVTVTKSLFSTYAAERTSPQQFLSRAAAAIKGMDLGRMAMALSMVQLRGDELTIANAGMPPILLLRASGQLEELIVEGMPLGGLKFDYLQTTLRVAPGDTLLLLSDGLPEQIDDGEPYGYERVQQLFANLAGRPVAAILEGMEAEVARLTGGNPPDDDVTFIALRIASSPGTSADAVG